MAYERANTTILEGGNTVATVKEAVRRVEVGRWLEDQIEEGRTVGRWSHIKQSPNVMMEAWNPSNTRTGNNAKGSPRRLSKIPAEGPIHE